MNMDLQYTKKFEDKLIAIRRDFHKYPEPAWLEYRTTVKIIEALDRLGIQYNWGKEIHTPELMMGKPSLDIVEEYKKRALKETGRADLIEKMEGGCTGVVAKIEGKEPGPTIGIRVDIDSNDLDESTDLSHRPNKIGFASKHPKAMHACAHDGHIAIGLGVAELLLRNKELLKGKVILIFQPAEEGGRGAHSVIGTKMFESMDYFFAGHIGINRASLGTVSSATYGFMAGTKFDAIFNGQASHAGKAPEIGRNALAAASTATLGLLSISRSGKGISRVNVGVMQGGSGRNIIPDHALIRAEVRGGNQEVSEYMFGRALKVCQAAADMYECTLDTVIMGKSMTVTCDMDFAEKVAQSAIQLPEIEDIPMEVDMGAGENVTFMMNEVQKNGGKATFMLLGADIKSPHHSSTFDFDEKVIPLAARLYSKIAMDLSNQQ